MGLTQRVAVGLALQWASLMSSLGKHFPASRLAQRLAHHLSGLYCLPQEARRLRQPRLGQVALVLPVQPCAVRLQPRAALVVHLVLPLFTLVVVAVDRHTAMAALVGLQQSMGQQVAAVASAAMAVSLASVQQGLVVVVCIKAEQLLPQQVPAVAVAHLHLG
jgi:hypothetical protein